MIEVYVGATATATDIGGWGTVVVEEDGSAKKDKGVEKGATQMAMILKAAIEGLGKTAEGSEVKLFSNNEYLILGMKDSRQRKANRDLWKQLDEVAGRRHVYPEHIAKHKWLSEARMLAKEATGG